MRANIIGGEIKKQQLSSLVRPKHLLKIVTEQEASEQRSLDDILLSPPPHRQLLQLHPGPSWRSFS